MNSRNDPRAWHLPGRAEIVNGRGGLPAVRIATPRASGMMYLHGGQVMSWQPAGTEDVLFVSDQARCESGRAIRGGVPVCFPWFGPHPTHPDAPAHGVVRTRPWHLDSIVANGDDVTVQMSIESDDDSRRWWPGDFRLVHRATFGAALVMELEATNTGTTPLGIEAALHTYYRVADVQAIRIVGLRGIRYRDCLDANRATVQADDVVITSETDRVYVDTREAVDIVDPVLSRRIRVAGAQAPTIVVWNPGITKARALADLGDDEWRRFVCVETCQVAPYGVDLAPRQTHIIRAVVTVER